MIEITRKDSMSIYMYFDENGNKELIKKFKEIKNNDLSYNLSINLDLSVIKMKKHKNIETVITIERDNHIEGSAFLIVDDKVVWKLDEDYIDIGIARFSDCKKVGFFSPPEFIRVDVIKNRNLDYLYCKLI